MVKNKSGYYTCPQCKEKYSTRQLAACCCYAYSPLKAAREDLGLTQTETAEVLQTSQDRLSVWESGSQMPSLDKMQNILGTFDIEAGQIYNYYFLKGQ